MVESSKCPSPRTLGSEHSIKKGGCGIGDPVLLRGHEQQHNFPLQQHLVWVQRHPRFRREETQFHLSVREDVAWRPDGVSPRVFVQLVQRTHVELSPRTAPGPQSWSLAGEGPTHLSLTGMPTSHVPPCNTASASLRRPGHSASCAATSSTAFSSHTAICPCARDRSKTQCDCPRLLRSRPGNSFSQEEKAGLLQPHPDSDGLPQRGSHDRPADVCIPSGKTPPRDFAVDSPPCTKPRPLRHPQYKTSPSMKHSNGRFMTRPTDVTRPVSASPSVFDGDARGWGDSAPQSRHLHLPARQHYVPPHSERHQSRTGSAHRFVTPP